MNIGQSINKVRKLKGIKQYVLAKKIGITQPYLSQIEKGNRKPSMDTLEAIVKSLNVPLPILFWESIEIEDISKEKQGFFKSIKPSVDELLKELY